MPQDNSARILKVEVAIEPRTASENIDILDESCVAIGLPRSQIVPLQGVTGYWVSRCHLQGVSSVLRNSPISFKVCSTHAYNSNFVERHRLDGEKPPTIVKNLNLECLRVDAMHQVWKVKSDVYDVALDKGSKREEGK